MGVLLSEAFECQFCHPSAPLDSGLRRNDEMGGPNDECEGMPEQSIPDRSPGHAFVAIAHAGWCRHTKV